MKDNEQGSSEVTLLDLAALVSESEDDVWRGGSQLKRFIKEKQKFERRSQQRIAEMASEMFSVFKEDDRVVIRIEKKCVEFNFYCGSPFREAYRKFPKGTKFTLDFVNVRFISSVALGLLIDFYRANGSHKKAIRLIRCNPTILNILTISRFDKLFDLVP